MQILGNQQAALLGHMCIEKGQAKNTYRSGCFLLCNTGTEVNIVTHIPIDYFEVT